MIQTSKARAALERQWSILHHHEKTEYRVLGDYDIICQDDESVGWVRRHIDTIQADIGTEVEILQVTREGFQSRTRYRLTRMGLEKIQRTFSQDPDHLK